MEGVRCPQCDATLTPEAPDGLCPKCLLRVALEPNEAETEVNALERTLDSAPAAPRVAAPIAAGQMFGEYELLEEIARGGMGIVFKAHHQGLDRLVALKMILSGQLASSMEVDRFYVEAQAAAKLDHPGIVPIFDVGMVNGQHYFSMAYVSGESLAERLNRDAFSPRDAAQMLLDIARAVQYAHENGVIHRDLKPANILLDETGPRITDFGLAKRTDSEAQLTVTGQALGTPSYMPPEQAAGKESMNRPTADVYALGAILYALLTGTAPFQADSLLETLKQVMEREPDAPRDLRADIPKDLEAVCLKCLEKEPEARYQTAGELVNELECFLEGRPVHARPLSPFGRLLRWRRIIERNRDVRISSSTRIFGVPLVDIALGHDEAKGETYGHAKGIFAFGDVATGVVAGGNVARGVFAYGKHAFGVVPFGATAVGVFPFGFACAGVATCGGFALGAAAFGMVAIGYYAVGMFAIGPHHMGGWTWP